MSISLIVKKFIAGIIAILMPITSSIAARQIQPPAETNGSNFHASEVHDMPVSNEDYVDESAPADGTETEAPAETTPEAPAEGTETTPEAPAEGTEVTPEAPAEGTETTPEAPAEDNQEAAPVAEWDISESDEDDVHMYYYNEEDSSILDTITASVKALFVPITAYADTTVSAYTEYTNSGRVTHKDGIVIIDGEGATDKMVFLNWLNKDMLAKDYEVWCENNDLVDDAYILREYVDEDGVLRGESVTGEYARGLYESLPEAERNYAMLDDFLPVHMVEFFEENKDNFWETYGEFIPTRVIVGKDVTNINLFAFGFCNRIESIQIENGSKLEQISTGAFAYTDITELEIPKATVSLGNSAFFGCEKLDNVCIKGILNKCGNEAFGGAAKDIKVTCAHVFTFCHIMGDSTDGMDVNDNDYEYFEDTLYNYGSTVTVALDTTLYNA